jgi:hypothetical protein
MYSVSGQFVCPTLKKIISRERFLQKWRVQFQKHSFLMLNVKLSSSLHTVE